MCEDNRTEVTEFLLLGFQDLHHSETPLFIIFLLIYSVILSGNATIIYLVTFHEHLQIPMFFYVKHLGLADILHSTNIVPMMLHIILNWEVTISFIGCLTQLYLFGVSGFVQCFLLAVMSFDRYLAICYPLHYISFMGQNTCLQLVCSCWIVVFILITSGMILVGQLKFCGVNHIDHFFCDFGPVVALSTSDTSVLIMQDFVNSIVMIFVPFIFIIITYICIVIAILRIQSQTGRKKAFSTCSSHLTVVCTYYGTLMIVYMVPAGENSHINKFLSLSYIVITPFMNPIIYSLRNKEIREILNKMLSLD